MRQFAEDIGDYAALLNNLYACKEGWINFNDLIDLMCSLIKKDRDHHVYGLDGAILQ